MFGRWTRHRVRVLAALLIVASLYFFFANTSNHDSKRTTFQDTPNLRRPPFPPPPPSPPKSAPDNTQAKSKPKDIETAKFGDNDVEIVIASMKKENVTWLHDYLPDWKKNIYVVDDPGAELSVPTNKGREAMVFLTYIIDRYSTLPGNIIFHHAERFQWHNDNADYDALTLLQRFRFDHLKVEGYVNLRCVWVLGCPAEIKPIEDAKHIIEGEPVTAKRVYKKAWEDLFPNEEIPEVVGVTCCSQFAVRRETIRRRPKADYIRIRKWLVESNLVDDLSGRVLEYAWHIIFGKKAVHCPDAGACYCKSYGMCDMKCDERGCDGHYTLPRFSTLPQGWPKLGWDGEDRHWSGLE